MPVENTKERPPTGLTPRIILAIISATLLLQPAMIYFYLIMGMGLPISQWVIVLLVAGIAKLYGNPLTIQELFVLSLVGGMGFGLGWYFLNPIKNLFFMISPITRSFGITDYIPWWFVPPYETSLYLAQVRTFFHPSWTVPLLLSVLTILLTIICDICLGYVAYQLYAVVEELDFPAYSMAAETIVELSSGGSRLKYFWGAIASGVIYNILSFWLAFASGNPYLQLVPRGLVDLTNVIETNLPGATFGFTTDLYPFLVGFLLPIGVSASMLAGAFGLYFIGNHLITRMDLWPEEAKWTPGMGMSFLTLRSQLYFWFSFCMGLAISALVIPLLTRPRTITKLIKSFSRVSETKVFGSFDPRLFLAVFLAIAIFDVLLVHFLVPGFPWWILLFFTVGWSLFSTFVSTYSVGVTFGGFGVPYLKEATIYYSGYRGMDIWFAPIIISMGGTWVAGSLRQADITNTNKADFIKAYLLVVFIGLSLGFVWASWFWASAPIPGSAYPYTISGWIGENIAWARWFKWLWSGHLFHEDLILAGFGVGTAIYLITSYILHAPYVLISVVTGIFMPPPYVTGSVTAGVVGGAMTMAQIGALTGQVSVPTFVFAYGPIPTTIANLVGSIVGKYIFEKRFGSEEWKRIAPLIVMGFGIGDATLWGIAWIVTMIGKSLWLLPY